MKKRREEQQQQQQHHLLPPQPMPEAAASPALLASTFRSSLRRSASPLPICCLFPSPHSFSSSSLLFSCFPKRERLPGWVSWPLLCLALLLPLRSSHLQMSNRNGAHSSLLLHLEVWADSFRLLLPSPGVGNDARECNSLQSESRGRALHLREQRQMGLKRIRQSVSNVLSSEQILGTGFTGTPHGDVRLHSQVGGRQLHIADDGLVDSGHQGRGQEIGEKKKSTGQSRTQEAAIMTTKHLFAGATSAVISRTFVAPLERIKLEYMLRGSKDSVLEIIQVIVAAEGLSGFWKGNAVNVLRTAPFKSVNFLSYDIYRKWLLGITGKGEATNFERLVAGAAAGVTATVLCFPLDTIRTKLVAPGGDALGGVVGCFQHMLRTEGFCSLYKGLLPAVVSMAPAGAVFYGVYDILKSSYLQSLGVKEELKRHVEIVRSRSHLACNPEGDLNAETENIGQLELGPMRTLLYGALAGVCAETITYPFEVIRRQLQMQDAATKMAAWATCQQLVGKGGLGALYAGLLPSSLQVLPSAALSYFVYESMKVLLKVS